MRRITTDSVTRDQRDELVAVLGPWLAELHPALHPTEDWARAYAESLLDEQNRWTWWALSPEGERVGCTSFCVAQDVHEPSRWIGEIDVLTVHAPFRRKGYGIELARAVLDELRRFGARAVEVTIPADRPEMRAFWEELGLRPTATVLGAPLEALESGTGDPT